MTEFKSSKIATATGVAALATMPVMLMSASASATSCPVDSTLVAPGVCQIQVTHSETLTLPTGIQKLSAVLVGGGGGSVLSGTQYGGGGGAVTYIDQVATTAPLEITIGAGGDSSNTPASTGGVTSIAGYSSTDALGGGSGTGVGGSSGSGTVSGFLSGAGAGGTSISDSQPGPGILPSAISGVDTTLFPVIAGEVALGAGGSPSATAAAPVNTGDGGNLGDGTAATQSGGSGEVLLRFALPVDLAHTGANTGLIAGLAGGLMAVGTSLVLASKRRAVRRTK